MKKLVFIFILGLFASCYNISFKTGSNSGEAARDYNNKIIEEISEINDFLFKYAEGIRDPATKDNTITIDGIGLKCDQTIDVLNSYGNFEGDDMLREAAIKYIELTKALINKEVREMFDEVEYYANNEELLNDEEKNAVYAKVIEMESEIKAEQKVVNNDFFEVQKAFAKKYNFKIDKIRSPKDGVN